MLETKAIQLRHHLFHGSLQAAAISFCLYWYFNLPKSSKALLVLAGVAALMMLMDMHPVHKAIYVIVVISLILLENRALDKERTEAAKIEASRREDENAKFQAIGDGIQTNISKSNEQLKRSDQIMGRVESTFQGTRRLEKVLPPSLKSQTTALADDISEFLTPRGTVSSQDVATEFRHRYQDIIVSIVQQLRVQRAFDYEYCKSPMTTREDMWSCQGALRQAVKRLP